MQSGATPARISRAVELVRPTDDNAVTEIRNAFISPIRGTNLKRPKFARHLLRARHGKSRFAFD